MTHLQTLKALGINRRHGAPFGRTRDNGWQVYRDKATGAIYLPRDPKRKYTELSPRNAMQPIDDARRAARLFDSVSPTDSVLDFGCGHGGLVEIMRDAGYNVDGYDPANPDMQDMTLKQYDVVTAFHVVEHLSDPITTLAGLPVKKGGTLVVEVPHAGDWLLHNSHWFRQFTLWSQHLILHTVDTLAKLLDLAGYSCFIEGVQRYPHANHIHWLIRGRPGCLDFALELDAAYAAHLDARGETDTLLAWAVKR